MAPNSPFKITYPKTAGILQISDLLFKGWKMSISLTGYDTPTDQQGSCFNSNYGGCRSPFSSTS